MSLLSEKGPRPYHAAASAPPQGKPRQMRASVKLALLMRLAARDVASPRARARAARDATDFPQMKFELNPNSRKGHAAAVGRGIMRRLPETAEADWEQAARDLRGCAGILEMPSGARWDETDLKTARRNRAA